MDTPPFFSVIASIHKFTPFFPGMMSSLGRQTFKNFELVLILDAPSHEDLRRIEELIGAYQDKFSCKTFLNQDRQGLTKNLNKAMAMAAGDVFVRLDSDDEMSPERLAVLKPHFDQGCIFLANASQVAVGGAIKSVYPDRALQRQEAQNLCLNLNRVAAHSAFSFHRSLLEMVGGYDERYRFSQDFDLMLRCTERLTDRQFRIIADPLTIINVHPSAISSGPTRNEQFFLQLCRIIDFHLRSQQQNVTFDAIYAALKDDAMWSQLEASNAWRGQLRSKSYAGLLLAGLLHPLRTLTMLRYRTHALRLVDDVTTLLSDKAGAGKT